MPKAIEVLEQRLQSLRVWQAMVREADENIAAGRVGKFDAEETKRVVRQRLAQYGTSD